MVVDEMKKEKAKVKKRKKVNATDAASSPDKAKTFAEKKKKRTPSVDARTKDENEVAVRNEKKPKRANDGNRDLDPTSSKKLKGILKASSTDDLSSSSASAFAEGESVEEAPLTNPSFEPKSSSSSSSSSSGQKRDKMRKKKEKKRAAKATAQEAKKNDAGEEIRRVEAREYLRCWKYERERWKFNKTRQTWLLKNLFLLDALDDEAFGLLLEYLRPLKGKAREETIKQAEAKVDESGVDFLQAERARVVVQMLA